MVNSPHTVTVTFKLTIGVLTIIHTHGQLDQRDEFEEIEERMENRICMVVVGVVPSKIIEHFIQPTIQSICLVVQMCTEFFFHFEFVYASIEMKKLSSVSFSLLFLSFYCFVDLVVVSSAWSELRSETRNHLIILFFASFFVCARNNNGNGKTIETKKRGRDTEIMGEREMTIFPLRTRHRKSQNEKIRRTLVERRVIRVFFSLVFIVCARVCWLNWTGLYQAMLLASDESTAANI